MSKSNSDIPAGDGTDDPALDSTIIDKLAGQFGAARVRGFMDRLLRPDRSIAPVDRELSANELDASAARVTAGVLARFNLGGGEQPPAPVIGEPPRELPAIPMAAFRKVAATPRRMKLAASQDLATGSDVSSGPEEYLVLGTTGDKIFADTDGRLYVESTAALPPQFVVAAVPCARRPSVRYPGFDVLDGLTGGDLRVFLRTEEGKRR